MHFKEEKTRLYLECKNKLDRMDWTIFFPSKRSSQINKGGDMEAAAQKAVLVVFLKSHGGGGGQGLLVTRWVDIPDVICHVKLGRDSMHECMRLSLPFVEGN